MRRHGAAGDDRRVGHLSLPARVTRLDTVATLCYSGCGTLTRQRNGSSDTLTYLHGDHLGSASLATDASGDALPDSNLRYYPYGERRLAGGAMPTDRLFPGLRPGPGTGQRWDAGWTLSSLCSLRYAQTALRKPQACAPTLGRFVSADVIVPEPGNLQSLNRYAYVLNNPLKYTDPTGHKVDPGGAYCPDYEDMFEAYDALAERTPLDAWRGYEQEYYALRAVDYLKKAEGRSGEEIEASASLVHTAWRRLAIAGYYGREPALREAWDAAAVDAYTALPQFGVAAAGVLAGSLGGTKTVDPVTGEIIDYFVVNDSGDVLMVPEGGEYAGGNGVFMETRYPNGSPFQQRHGPHAGTNYHHGHSFLKGAGRNSRGWSLDIYGNVVHYDDPAAHWFIRY